MFMIPSVAQLNDKQSPEIPSVFSSFLNLESWDIFLLWWYLYLFLWSFWGMFLVASAQKKIISFKKKKKEKFEV